MKYKNNYEYLDESFDITDVIESKIEMIKSKLESVGNPKLVAQSKIECDEIKEDPKTYYNTKLKKACYDMVEAIQEPNKKEEGRMVVNDVFDVADRLLKAQISKGTNPLIACYLTIVFIQSRIIMWFLKGKYDKSECERIVDEFFNSPWLFFIKTFIMRILTILIAILPFFLNEFIQLKLMSQFDIFTSIKFGYATVVPLAVYRAFIIFLTAFTIIGTISKYYIFKEQMKNER